MAGIVQTRGLRNSLTGISKEFDKIKLEMLTDRLRERLEGHSVHTIQDLLARTADDLATIPGIGPVTAQKLLDMARQTLEKSLAEQAEESMVGEE